MVSETVEITSKSIQKILKKYTPERAIAEYIWNGFDANATELSVNIVYSENDFGLIDSIEIIDNGDGICYEQLDQKFKVFYDSVKMKKGKQTSDLVRGKNGYGRLTFFKFARFATWTTCYQADEELYSYDISINSDDLRHFTPSKKTPMMNKKSGTIVSFKDISVDFSSNYIKKNVIPFLISEFAWFLEVRKDACILINGEPLDYKSAIKEREVCQFTVSDSNHTRKVFEAVFLLWNNRTNEEYSKFYFLNSDFKLKYKKNTKLNNKGDNFYHSLILIDDFFNKANVDEDEEDGYNGRTLFDSNEDKFVFKELEKKLNEFLSEKRRPFLKKQANIVIQEYEKAKILPKFGDNAWDVLRKKSFIDFLRDLYEVKPAMFSKLNTEQKRVFLELLNLVMDSSERKNLFPILDAIIDLGSDDRARFSKLLQTTQLKQVLNTINLIKDRILVVEDLKKVLFDHGLKAGEIKHLQKIIEAHYWIFGEEYNLVCAEEVKFTQALEKYRYLLLGVDEKEFIDHPDKYKEMDLFLTATDYQYNAPKNLVVEIKNPTNIKKITYKEFEQIQRYEDVIMKTDAFNDNRESWTFILIGQDIDSHLCSILKGVDGLAYDSERSKIYVKRWSEIINDIEFRHKYLLDKLKIVREKLSNANDLDSIMNELQHNDATT